MKIRLRVISGENAGNMYDVGDCLRIGRGSVNDIVLKETYVSREHAMLIHYGNSVMLVNKGLYPTIVEGVPVTDQRELKIDDVITICSTQFKLEAVPETYEMDNTALIESMQADAMYSKFINYAVPGAIDDNKHNDTKRLKALYELTQLLSGETDHDRLVDSIGDAIFRLIPANNLVILLQNPGTGELEPQCMRTRDGDEQMVSYSHSLAQRSFDSSDALHWTLDTEKSLTESISYLHISSALCAPLEYQDRKLGVIYCDTRGSNATFTPHYDLEFVVAFARSAAIALCNTQYLDMLQQSFRNTLVAISNAIEMRDHYTAGHTWRVSRLSVEITRNMGLDQEKVTDIEMGGVLHDVGKLAISDNILTKPAALTEEEFITIKEHPQRGAQMLDDVDTLRTVIPCVLYHHEKWDGTGYPFGLKGNGIPIEGRIIAVADVFDAMTSDRSYRKGVDIDVAIQFIKENSGTQFDPSCVAAFIQCHENGLLQSLVQAGVSENNPTVVCPYCSTHFSIPASFELDESIRCHICHRNLRLRLVDHNVEVELLSS